MWMGFLSDLDRGLGNMFQAKLDFDSNLQLLLAEYL